MSNLLHSQTPFVKHAGKPVLLVMDLVESILTMSGNPQAFVTQVQTAIAHARKHNVPVWYIKPNFRPSVPEIHANNKFFSKIKPMLQNAPAETFDASVAPQPDDLVFGKFRISAFSGNELDIVLRAQGIEHLVLTGLATSGAVLSTVRAAADKDYQITVLSDGCFDHDPEVHDVLMNKVFPMQANVMTVDDWATSL